MDMYFLKFGKVNKKKLKRKEQKEEQEEEFEGFPVLEELHDSNGFDVSQLADSNSIGFNSNPMQFSKTSVS